MTLAINFIFITNLSSTYDRKEIIQILIGHKIIKPTWSFNYVHTYFLSQIQSGFDVYLMMKWCWFDATI